MMTYDGKFFVAASVGFSSIRLLKRRCVLYPSQDTDIACCVLCFEMMVYEHKYECVVVLVGLLF